MNAQIIDGKTTANKIQEELAARVASLKEKGKCPGLAVLLVGDDPASHVYVRNKEKGCHNVGMYSEVYRLPAETTQDELLKRIDELNKDPKIHGILVQIPLPDHLDELAVVRAVDPKKDVDGIHLSSLGALVTGDAGFEACTPKGIIRLIKNTGVSIEGKSAVVVGRSTIVGKPAALLLLNENATVTICHSRTKNLKEFTKRADILVTAVGKPSIISGDMIKEGAVVIDAGTSSVNGKLKGDVNFEEACQVAGYITPVPGGVGPMTIAMLLENTVEACENEA